MSDELMRWVLRHDNGKWYREQRSVPVEAFHLATTYPTKKAAESAVEGLAGYTPELVNVRVPLPLR